MLVDANLLLFAVDESSTFHQPAAAWLTRRLNGSRRTAFPWPSLLAFVRIVTHPRASQHPLSATEAWGHVEAWLTPDVSWIAGPTDRHGEILGELVRKHDVRGRLVPDAHLAALALEHGLAVASADTDFARFTEVRWINPLTEATG